MFAYEIPGARFSLPAGADVARHRLVSVDASGNGVVASATTPAVGVSMNKADAGQVLEVADGIVMVTAAGAITAGVKVHAAADGKVSATGDNEVGVALTAATADGEIITIKM